VYRQCAPLPSFPPFPSFSPFLLGGEVIWRKRWEGRGENGRRDLLTGVSLCRNVLHLLFPFMTLPQYELCFYRSTFNMLFLTCQTSLTHYFVPQHVLLNTSFLVYKTSLNMTQCTLNISFFSCKTQAARYSDVNAL